MYKLTTKEVAKAAGVNDSRVRQRIKELESNGLAEKVGRDWRLSADAVPYMLNKKAGGARTATHWHWYRADGVIIAWIDGNEGTGRRIASVTDTTRTAPAVRIIDGEEQPLHDEPDGLIVLGLHKWDRPGCDAAAELLPAYREHFGKISDLPTKHPTC